MEPTATTATAATAPAAPYAPSATHVLWRWITAAAIFGNILLNYWSNAHPFNGQTMGVVSAKYPTLLTPAGLRLQHLGGYFSGPGHLRGVAAAARPARPAAARCRGQARSPLANVATGGLGGAVCLRADCRSACW